MDPQLFARDIEETPLRLRALADLLPTVEWPVAAGQRLLLTGMGSSYFAADTVARRMRRAGIAAVADLASVEGSYPPAPDLAVVGISASGGSGETLELLRAHHGPSTTVALTNSIDAELPAHHTLQMRAGVEAGGVACRSYLHTLVMLLQLEQQLAGTVHDLVPAVLAAADAVDDLLQRRDDWLPPVLDALTGPHGTWIIGPAERLGNAWQGALMFRECCRRVADGCETGDWNHVDVYLTKSVDYRALLFTGSRYDGAATRWIRDRGSRFVAVGAPSEGAHDAEFVVRYEGDTDPLVALLTEVVVPQIVAVSSWMAQ